jgi:hypothetical protein
VVLLLTRTVTAALLWTAVMKPIIVLHIRHLQLLYSTRFDRLHIPGPGLNIFQEIDVDLGISWLAESSIKLKLEVISTDHISNDRLMVRPYLNTCEHSTVPNATSPFLTTMI